jgi:GT2 family glycosyltransferase
MSIPVLRSTVLVASFRRAQSLTTCLQSLAVQTVKPNEVIVAWQGDDSETLDTISRMRSLCALNIRDVHCPVPGIVPAENAALNASSGEIILLIDDDAVAPAEWIARHLRHYSDPRTGAVGGPYDNFDRDGRPFPKRASEPIGRLSWYGKPFGNMYDQETGWQSRTPREIDHVVGNNMSVRRAAFERMEEGLKPYWQAFEMDLCLQVKAHGYKVLFDFENRIQHYPTNTVYMAGRDGDLQVKVYNAAYNHAFVLGKHSPKHLRYSRLLYLLLVGSIRAPGAITFLPAIAKYGHPRRELRIFLNTWQSRVSGWRAGSAKAAQFNGIERR